MGNTRSTPTYQKLKRSKDEVDEEESRKLQQALDAQSMAIKDLQNPGIVPEQEMEQHIEQAREAAKEKFFFNREEEMDELLRILSSPPNRPVIIIGAKDTGKTMLLKQVQKICQFHLPVMMIDLRGADVSTPAALAEVVKAEVLEWIDAFLSVLGSIEVSPTVGSNFKAKLACAAKLNLFPPEVVKKLRGEAAGSSGLGQLLSGFRKFVAANKSSFQCVIVIDEADRLKAWGSEHQVELDTLLGFFAWLTKQEGYTHVLLASSDDFFRHWLHYQEKLEYRVVGLGNFGKSEARRFFDTRCFIGYPLTTGQQVADWSPHWEKIFKVTGGSPTQLMIVSESANVSRLSWNDAIEERIKNAVDALDSSIDKYLESMPAEEMDAAHEAVVMTMAEVAKSEGCVSVNEVIKSVFPSKSRQQARLCVYKMVQYNIFHLRYRKPGVKYQDMGNADPSGESHAFLMPYRPAQLEAILNYPELHV